MGVQFELLRYFEEQQLAAQQKDLLPKRLDRLFSLLCLSHGFTTKNIKVDTMGVYNLIRRSPAAVATHRPALPGSGSDFLHLKRAEAWGLVFDMEAIQQKHSDQSGWKFGDEVVTDGYGCSVTYTKFIPKPAGEHRRKKPRRSAAIQPEPAQPIDLSQFSKVCRLLSHRPRACQPHLSLLHVSRLTRPFCDSMSSAESALAHELLLLTGELLHRLTRAQQLPSLTKLRCRARVPCHMLVNALQRVCCCAQVCGVDPGRNEVFVASTQPHFTNHADYKASTTSFSAGRYFQQSSVTTSNARIANWQQRDATYKAIIANMPSAKTCNPLALQVRQARCAREHAESLLGTLPLQPRAVLSEFLPCQLFMRAPSMPEQVHSPQMTV